MSKLNTFIKLIKNDRQRIFSTFVRKFAKTSACRHVSDKLFLKIAYKAYIGKTLNLDNPQTFNEKLQWLKLYNRKPVYSTMVDKHDVKKYVADKIGQEYIIPTLGVWNKFEDIDFSALPDKFVLKCTHDSGSVVICSDKSSFDYEKAKAKLNRGINSNLFWHGREWPYKDLPPRIIAEQYLEDEHLKDLRDYKLFCFNGVCRCFKVDFDRFSDHRANYFDTDKNLLKFGEKVCLPDFDRSIDVPDAINDMMVLAEKLSKDIPFLRVDFYYANGRIYFGELTFFPASGFGPFVPEEWDNTLGSWITLPEKK